MTDFGVVEIFKNLTAGVEEEIVATRSLSTSFQLGRGRRSASASNRPLYHFDLKDSPRLQEESRGMLRIGNQEVECVVLSRRSDGLDISTFAELGDEIPSATLVINKSEVLEVLGERLRDVDLSDDSRTRIPRELLSKLRGTEVAANGVDVALPEDLTEDQKGAARAALSRDTTLLWGPPGTGKTVTLAAIAWQLFQDNKRVLIVSHTNQAVDGVVEILCRRIVGRARMALPEATILRLGTIARRSLAASFGEQIGFESLVALRGRKAQERAEGIKKEIEAINRALEQYEAKSRAAVRLAEVKDELVTLQESYTKARLSEGALKTFLRVLRIKYGEPTDGTSIRDLERAIKSITAEIFALTEQLEGSTPDEVIEETSHLKERREQLQEAVNDLAATQERGAEGTIQHARVVACTASQAILRLDSLNNFDAVLIDEGSMLPLPYVALLATVPRERIVVAGDFRQLPPISVSNGGVAREWFARDIFEVAGVVDAVEQGNPDPRLVTLTSHFRGHETLCQIINDRFYGGRLVPKSSQPPPWDAAQAPLGLSEHPILVVDTSALSPQGHAVSSSKANLLHALIVRKVVALLKGAGMVEQPGDLGVIAPYRPQVSLIEDLLREASLTNVTVGTVHRFQGGERRTVILDLTESPPHRVGTFLGPRSLRDAGAKLLNVSLSRAQHRLVVIGNLAYLDQQLAEDQILRGIIDDLRRLGHVVDASCFLDEGLAPSANEDTLQEESATSFQRFDRESLLAGLGVDLGEARRSVVFGSQTVTARSAHVVGTMLRPVVAKGVQCVVHTPVHDEGNEGCHVLRSSGVAVRLGPADGTQCIVIDDEVLWFGDIPPLESVESGAGTMVRVVGKAAVDEFRRAHEWTRVAEEAERIVGNL